MPQVSKYLYSRIIRSNGIMSIADILEFAKARIPLEISKDEKRLQTEIARITAEASLHGGIRSSRYILLVQEACAHAMSERIKSAWEVLHRGITTVGVEYNEGLEAQLEAAVESYFPEHMSNLKHHVTEAAKRTGMSDIVSKMPDEIGNARRAAFAEVASEIRLFVLALNNNPDNTLYNPQFNFHNSTIGAVQTGGQSVANVQIQTGIAVEGLIKALDTVLQSLGTIGDIPGCDKSEIIELVEDGKRELQKEKPNKTKLASYLPIISNTLNIVSDLKPAYEGLKAAASAFGFML